MSALPPAAVLAADTTHQKLAPGACVFGQSLWCEDGPICCAGMNQWCQGYAPASPLQGLCVVNLCRKQTSFPFGAGGEKKPSW